MATVVNLFPRNTDIRTQSVASEQSQIKPRFQWEYVAVALVLAALIWWIV